MPLRAGGRAAVAALLLAVCAAAATDRRRLGATQQPAVQAVPGKIIVKLKNDYLQVMSEDRDGLRFSRPAGLDNAAVYHITDGMSVDAKLAELNKMEAVEFAEPDYRVSVNWVPNDALLNLQWHHSVIGSQVAWQASTGKGDVKVCHLDSGVRLDHPDLKGHVIGGWNLVPEIQSFDQPTPAPGSAQYKNYNDTFGHGTHTAGIIAATGNNGLGGAGVAMDVKILVCKFIWDDGMGSVSDALECLRLCKEAGATISSNSWGGVANSRLIEEALKQVQEAGMLFVVASGNQGDDLDARPKFPASSRMENMIVVGSTGQADVISSFSNRGRNTVHLTAPGEQIVSTLMNGWYGPMDGTSMSTPMVAAAAALLQSAAAKVGVRLSHVETKRLLLSSVDVSASPDTAAATITGGRLNVGTAMRALAILLKERGLPALPGMAADDAAAVQLKQRMLASPWGQLLLAATVARQPAAAGAAGAAAAAVVKPGTAGPAGKAVKPGVPRPAGKAVKPGTASTAPAGGAGALKAKDLTVGPLDGLPTASPAVAEAPLPAPADEAATPAPAPTEAAAEAAVQAAVMPRQHRRLRMASKA